MCGTKVFYGENLASIVTAWLKDRLVLNPMFQQCLADDIQHCYTTGLTEALQQPLVRVFFMDIRSLIPGSLK